MSIRSVDRSASGLSLIEVLTAMGLGAIVLYLLVALLIPGIRASSRGTHQVDLHQRALIVSQRLMSTLQRSARAGISVHQTAPSELMLTVHPRKPDTSGIFWEQSLHLYHWQNSSLTARALELTTAPQTAFSPDLGQLTGLSSQSSSVVTELKDVESFKVNLSEGPSLDFEIVLKKAEEGFTLRRTAFFRNSTE